jgi:Phosphotransferase enzyme family
VVRMGDTVRRTWRTSTPTVHSYLRHVRARGVQFVPEPQGRDDDGREVLSFVPGDVPVPPLPGWATCDEVVVDLALMIAALHAAAEDWRPPPDASWGRLPASSPPDHRIGDPGVLASHGDYCPGNVVFDAQRPIGLIDFDLVRPTTRLDDCVNALHWWAPLTDPRDRPDSLREADIARRVRLFADAYGMDAADRERLPAAALDRATRSLAWAQRSAQVDPLFARWWREGWSEQIPRTVAWLQASQEALATGLRRAS